MRIIPIYMGKPGHFHGRGDFFYYLYTDPCITRIHQQDEIKARVYLQSKFPKEAYKILKGFNWVEEAIVNGPFLSHEIKPFLNEVPSELEGIEPRPCRPAESYFDKEINSDYWICHLSSEDPSNDLHYNRGEMFPTLISIWEHIETPIVLVGGARDSNFNWYPRLINRTKCTSTLETYSLIKGSIGFVGSASWVFLVSMLENKPIKMLTHNPGYYKEMESWLYPRLVGYKREEITV